MVATVNELTATYKSRAAYTHMALEGGRIKDMYPSLSRSYDSGKSLIGERAKLMKNL
jgi:hypothetical protein